MFYRFLPLHKNEKKLFQVSSLLKTKKTCKHRSSLFLENYHSIPIAPKIPYPSESAQQISGAVSKNAITTAILVKKFHSRKISGTVIVIAGINVVSTTVPKLPMFFRLIKSSKPT